MVKEAPGTEINSNQIVQAHCILTAGDLSIWDTRNEDKPFKFKYKVDKMIPGFDEAISYMSVGDRFVFTMPPELGYGAKGSAPSIPENATLTFDIEILGAMDPKIGISDIAIKAFHQQDLETAISEIKTLYEIDAEAYDFGETQYVILASRLRQENNFEAYLAVLELTISVHPESADAFNRLARVYSDLDRGEEALEVLNRAVEINGGNSQTQLMQAEFKSPSQ